MMLGEGNLFGGVGVGRGLFSECEIFYFFLMVTSQFVPVPIL